MGAELDKLNSGPDKGTDSGTGTGTCSGSATGNTGTGSKGTGGTGSSTGTGSGTGKTKEKVISSVPTVEDENKPPVIAEPKKKATRKKVTRKKKKEPEVSFNAAQLQALIISGTAIISTRENMSMFALSEEEAMQLATPIANMIEKSERLQNMGEYADAIALVTACLLIFIPRFMLYGDVKKKEKLKKNGGIKIVRTDTGNKTGQTEKDHKRNDGKSAANSQAIDQSFRSVLPVTDGF